MPKLRFLCLLLLLFFAACRKNELIDKVTVEEEPPKVLVVSSFKGKVLDENGQPVSGAVVRIYQATTLTNANGLFEFKNIEAPKDAALVQVEKAGYFSGSAMIGNRSGAQQYARVTLMQKGGAQTVDAGSGGTLTWPGGLQINILPNSLRRADGSSFNGQARMSARWLDPTDPALGGIMPGALMARDAEGNEIVLSTFGMAALELSDGAGQPLVLSEDAAAELQVPIPDELLASAPEEIPLWYFDLEKERWLQDGVCKKSGAVYLCKVVKGGYWNCDLPLESICLSGTIYQSDSTPALYTKVIVEDLSDNFIYWGYTDLQGFFCGSVPRGALLKITIEDLCKNVLYTDTIGPFPTDTDLGDIYLPQTLQQYFIHVSGQLNDCAGQAVTTGQVAVVYPGKTRLFPLGAAGSIDFDLALNCIEFPELQIRGYDLATFKSTPLVVHSDDSDVVLGTLNACEDPGDFLHLSVDGTAYHAAPTRFFLKNNTTTNWMVLQGLTTGGTFEIELRQYSGAGTYSTNTFFQLSDSPDAPAYPALDAASPDVTVIITSDNGQFIEGSISGTAYDPFSTPHAISGDFRIKKQL